MITRCAWAGTDPLYIAYHDQEWGVPLHDDRLLFEFLILDGMQAGLSWAIILKKRDNFRRLFDNFDPSLIATYDDARVAALLATLPQTFDTIHRYTAPLSPRSVAGIV